MTAAYEFKIQVTKLERLHLHLHTDPLDGLPDEVVEALTNLHSSVHRAIDNAKPPTDFDHTKVLNAPLESSDNQDTIGDWLESALRTLWNEGEGFSGKRPLGNSGWEGELMDAVIESGMATTEEEAGDLIDKAIVQMFEETRGQ